MLGTNQLQYKLDSGDDYNHDHNDEHDDDRDHDDHINEIVTVAFPL